MRKFAAIWCTILFLIIGCSEQTKTSAGADSDADTDTNTDADTESDSAGSSDTDHGPIVVNECDHPESDWVFCSSFEEGNKDIWDDYDGNPDETNLLMEDPGPFDLDGNHVMRLRAPAERGGADLVKVLERSSPKYYARWYIKYEPGFDFNAPDHGGGLHAGSRDLLGRSDVRPNGDDWYTAWIDYDSSEHVFFSYSYYRGMYMDCVNPEGSCWGDHFPCFIDEGETYCEREEHRETVMPPTLETDRWYCVELLLDGGPPVAAEDEASGVIDFWVDGLEIGPFEHLWLRTTEDLEITILWLSLFHHEEQSVEGVMYDNVVVSKDRIGCL
jgi:hypothetical protein